MALTCNINSKGKALRLIMGAIDLIAGLALLFFWAIPGGGKWAWGIAIGLLVLGIFQAFEGWAGWCFVRAMGIKTRI